MKRPWQVWLLFAVCVLGAFAGMIWLTRQALEADERRRMAEAQAELEQRVSLALWRMDTELAPIIAEEVVRPPSAFRLTGVAAKPPQFVLMQFEATAKGAWRSPQISFPSSVASQLDALSNQIDYSALLAKLPNTPLPSFQQDLAANADLNSNLPTIDGLQAFNPPQAQVANEYYQNLQLPTKQNEKPNEAADLEQRARRYQSAAQQSLINSAQNQSPAMAPAHGNVGKTDNTQPELVGVSKPFWVGDRLILARRVTSGNRAVVQGSWLIWEKLKSRLLGEATELLPKADLVAVKSEASTDPARMLAGLPVRLVVNEPAQASAMSPALRWALAIGWGAVLLAVIAAALLLAGVMTLSERRAAFVSSVTHELRTPLTTFRMYSEMLAKGMVPDAARRQEYFETLQKEAERLTLLVENVLAYSRLERGRRPQGQDRVTLEGLLDRIGPRLKQRAAQAGMECIITLPLPLGEGRGEGKSSTDKAPSPCALPEGEGSKAEFTTDMAVVEQILFNLVDNAAKYARTATDRRIHVEVNDQDKYMTFTVRDHGPGIGSAAAARTQPFEKSAQESAETAPGVGLGLALCRRLARELGGRLEANDSDGGGASVTLSLPAD
jgi:signal transduction histidine kinase